MATLLSEAVAINPARLTGDIEVKSGDLTPWESHDHLKHVISQDESSDSKQFDSIFKKRYEEDLKDAEAAEKKEKADAKAK